jgi:hypothetical protein
MTRFYPALIVDGVAFLATTYGRPEIPGVQAHTMGSGTPVPLSRPGEGVKPLGVFDQRERSAGGRRIEPGDQASVEERDLPVNTPVEPESDQLTGGEDVEGESSTRAHPPEKPPDDRRGDTVDQVGTEARLAETEKRHAEVHGAKLDKRRGKEKRRWYRDC